jgi:signal transduction histidine kinase
LPERELAALLVPLLVLTAVATGRWAPRGAAIAGGAALIVVSLVWAAASHGSGVAAVLLPGAGWCVGRALHERELITRRLDVRAREVEEEREAYAGLSARYERARIASELHDIVAHAISVMVVQASAGQRLAAVSPALAAEAFDAIAGAAHDAEADMGRLVELLADEPTVGEVPDLRVVEQLVARAADTGLAVTLRLEGEHQGLPSHAVHTANRVVREGLTNALRYASGAPVQVLIRGERETLLIEVGNDRPAFPTPPSSDGTGTGLRGLHELLDSARGQLEVGVTSTGGWLLSAQIPLAT